MLCARARSLAVDSATTTLAPSLAKVSAIALPNPDAAPVTIATLFSSFMALPFLVGRNKTIAALRR